MTTTITFNDFCDGFTGSYKNTFSYDGKRALFDHLEEYEDETDEQIDFDPMTLACSYSEYKNIAEFSKEYGQEFTLEELKNETSVLEMNNGGLIIVAF